MRVLPGDLGQEGTLSPHLPGAVVGGGRWGAVTPDPSCGWSDIARPSRGHVWAQRICCAVGLGSRASVVHRCLRSPGAHGPLGVTRFLPWLKDGGRTAGRRDSAGPIQLLGAGPVAPGDRAKGDSGSEGATPGRARTGQGSGEGDEERGRAQAELGEGRRTEARDSRETAQEV